MPSVYFDASVIIALLVEDAFNDRADKFLIEANPTPVISSFGAAEFASVMALRVRSLMAPLDLAAQALSRFDAWRAQLQPPIEIEPADVATAEAFLRRLDLPLRTPDGLHLAMARR